MEKLIILFWYGFLFFVGSSIVLTWDTLKTLGWGAPKEDYILHISTNPTKGLVYGLSLYYAGAGYVGVFIGVWLYRLLVGKK